MDFKRLTNNDKDFLLEFLLHEKYLSEFKIIDGLKRHPDDLGFTDWVYKILYGKQ